MIIIKRLTIIRMVNKDATLMKVLETFKENEYFRNTLIKEKDTIKLYNDNYTQKMRSCTTIVITVPIASLRLN